MQQFSSALEVINRAADLFRRGRPRAALVVLRRSEELLADNGMAWQIRGLLHFELRNYAEALSALEHASLLIPLALPSQCRLAECYLRTRRRDVARTIYVYLAELEMVPEDIVATIARGLATVGELETSLDFCLRHLRTYCGSHELHFIAATVMQRQGAHGADIYPFAHQAFHLRPEVLPYRILYAQQLLAIGRHQDAQEVLCPVDPQQIKCIASLERLRLLFSQLGHEEAQSACQARLERIGYERSAAWRPPHE